MDSQNDYKEEDASFQQPAQDGPQSQSSGNISQGNQQKTNQYQGLIDAYEGELQCVDESNCPNIAMLVRNELFRLRGGVIDTVDVLAPKKTKVRAKVDIPVETYPNVNFVGKLLGPAGKTLKTIQEQTNTKMSILGSGSLRNPTKEQELLSSGDPKYNHLRDRLHLQVDAVGNASEAYYNISYALAEVKKVMTPDTPEGGFGQMGPVTPLMGNMGGYGQMGGQMRGGGQRGRGGRGRGRGNAAGGAPRGGMSNFNQMYMNGSNETGFADDYAPMGFDNYGGGFEPGRGGGKMMRGGDRMRGANPYSRPM